MENRNRLRDFPKRLGFFINNCLASMVSVILHSQLPSSIQQCRSSYMMKLQGLVITEQGRFGGRRTTFGFVVLPFVGVTLFLSPTGCGSCVVP